MDAVMTGLLLAVGVYAAAGDDGHIRICADVKVVVHEIVHIPVRHTGGDEDGFTLRLRQHVDDEAGRILFGVDFDVCARLTGGALAVLADVERALKGALPIGYDAEEHFGNLIHGA